MSAGVLGFDLTLLVSGAVVLRASGFAVTGRSLLPMAGLAFLCGFGLASLAVTFQLMAGLPFSVTAFVLTLACATAVTAGLARISRSGVPRLPRPWQRGSRERLLTALPAVLLVLYLGALLRRTIYSGINWWDAWAFWVPRAESIAYSGGIRLGSGGFDAFAHPEYPPGLPGLNAMVFRFAGRVDPLTLPIQDWIIAVAFLLALTALLAPRVPSHILAAGLLLIALTPNFGRQIGALTGDLPLAILFAIAGILGIAWLEERRGELLVLAALFVSAAATTKKEGLFLGVLLAVVIGLVAPHAGARRRPALALAIPPAIVAGCWSLWLRAHHVPASGDYTLSNLVDPSFLISRLGRLGVVLRLLPAYFLKPSLWLVAIPAAVVVAVLARREAPLVSRLVLVLVPLAFVGMVCVYWIGNPEVHWYLATSAERIPGPIVFLCLACLPIMFGQAQGSRHTVTPSKVPTPQPE